jgi:hypothetical protein
VKRDRLVFDLPHVLTPHVLVGAMFMIVLAALTNDDSWMRAAGVGLLIDAALVRVHTGLRER